MFIVFQAHGVAAKHMPGIIPLDAFPHICSLRTPPTFLWLSRVSAWRSYFWIYFTTCVQQELDGNPGIAYHS